VVGRCAGKPLGFGPRFWGDFEEVVATVSGLVRREHQSTVAPGNPALGVDVVRHPGERKIVPGFGVQDVDVLLALRIGADERDLLAVGSECNGIRRDQTLFPERVTGSTSHIDAGLELGAVAVVVPVVLLGALRLDFEVLVIDHVPPSGSGDERDLRVVDGEVPAVEGVERRDPGMAVDDDTRLRLEVAPVGEEQPVSTRRAVDGFVHQDVSVGRRVEPLDVAVDLVELREIAPFLFGIQVGIKGPFLDPLLEFRVYIFGLVAGDVLDEFTEVSDSLGLPTPESEPIGALENRLERAGPVGLLQKRAPRLAELVDKEETPRAPVEESAEAVAALRIGVDQEVADEHFGFVVESVVRVVFRHPFDKPKRDALERVPERIAAPRDRAHFLDRELMDQFVVGDPAELAVVAEIRKGEFQVARTGDPEHALLDGEEVRLEELLVRVVQDERKRLGRPEIEALHQLPVGVLDDRECTFGDIRFGRVVVEFEPARSGSEFVDARGTVRGVGAGVGASRLGS